MALRVYGRVANVAAPLLFRRIRDRLIAHGTAPARTRERLGHATLPRPAGRLIWFHGASVGESLSALPVIAALLDQPDAPTILVTSGTATSAQILAQRMPQGCIHQFAPLDSAAALRRFNAHWQPDLLVLMESEIWPQMIATAPCPVVLLNARLSPRALARWQKLGASAGWLLGQLTLIIAQTEAVETGLRSLGVTPGRIRTGANLKAAAAPPSADPHTLAQMNSALGTRPRWLAASTHAGEEALLLDVHKALLATSPDLCLIIAPRHPDRADRIAQLIADAGLTLTRRSDGDTPTAQVYLADTLGEMGLWYRTAPLTFIGGSLTPNGGHNPWEAAPLGTALLTGANLNNCAADWHMLAEARGATSGLTPQQLTDALRTMLNDPQIARDMASNAAACAAAQKGDLARIAAELTALLPAKDTA